MGPTAYDRPLSADAVTRVMTAIMAGQCPPEEIRAFLSGLAERGETAEEIAAAVRVLRAHAVRLPLSQPLELCDTCGTGGDGRHTVNASTLAALVAAAAGVRVAKHGNRAASSRCGSADLLEALGVNLAATPEQVARCLETTGFTFCFAPVFHPAMKAVAPIRKALGRRTLFNLIGPLANPAPLAFQLVGVSTPDLLRPMAEALQRLGIRHGFVVHGRDGMDEVTTTGPTDVLEVTADGITPVVLEPDAMGFSQAPLEALRGGDAADNAEVARAVLAGAASPVRDLVAANAGCAIYLAGRAATVREGVATALRVLERGDAVPLLARVVELLK